MALTPGTQLGPYSITALIRHARDGEVYRAHDPRLDRDVAIKVAAEAFTERFTREARAIAALNHTNICHLYDVGPNYLVMELVEGESPRGPLAFEEALPILRQLIDGIEAAHEKGIVHRDLKPANIRITPDGVVKILDFGLAKALEPDGADGPLRGGVTNSPTMAPSVSMGATPQGTILGTAAYMAPEQAKGRQADKRSDIWSFGVVAYELLTGQRLFQGETPVVRCPHRIGRATAAGSSTPTTTRRPVRTFGCCPIRRAHQRPASRRRCSSHCSARARARSRLTGSGSRTLRMNRAISSESTSGHLTALPLVPTPSGKSPLSEAPSHVGVLTGRNSIRAVQTPMPNSARTDEKGRSLKNCPRTSAPTARFATSGSLSTIFYVSDGV